MMKVRPQKQKAYLAVVRKKARDLAIGKDQPGTFNPHRTIRFTTPSNKTLARGRTYKGEW